MAFNEQSNKNKARAITAALHILLLIWFAFYGLTYQDPPPEEGIAINFGYDDAGLGNTSEAAETSVPTPVAQQPAQPVQQEEVVTQNVEEAPVIEQTEEETTKKTPVTEPITEPVNEVKPVTEPVTEPDPQRTEQELEEQRKRERLNQLFNSGNGTGSGEGVTQGGGDQGDPNGDILSPNREGNGGIGNSGDYYLAGRDPRNRPKPINDCNKEGVVVVKIRVDANGMVREALGGVNIPNGPSSNFGTSTCLVKRAEEAAKKTTWTAKSGANLQVGYIVYRFELR
ncbi:MAG: hypothetical protein RL754_25 [Bacteroidota bacterium]|jgi:outer membrane biosynthesis protein TonB